MTSFNLLMWQYKTLSELIINLDPIMMIAAYTIFII